MHGIGLDNLTVNLSQLSHSLGEPDWLCEWRLQAASQYDSARVPLLASAMVSGLHNILSREEGVIPKDFTQATQRAQSDSDDVFQKLRTQLAERGVIVEKLSKAALIHPELVRPYLGTIAPDANEPCTRVNSMLWSEGWFVYVPRGVHVEAPLQISTGSASGGGACQRTLIVCEEDSRLEVLEGCPSPKYIAWPMLLSVVEIAAKHGAYCRYTSIQNWTHKVSRHDTMCSRAHADSKMDWNVLHLGGESTESVPCTYLIGPGAQTEICAASYAGASQHRMIGGHAIHCAPGTASRIISKIVRESGGDSWDCSVVEMLKGCRNSSTRVECEALLLSEEASAHLTPKFEVDEATAEMHQSTRSTKGNPQDLMAFPGGSRTREQAMAIRVAGFLEPFTSRLPKEYAVEVHRWIELAMEGSVG